MYPIIVPDLSERIHTGILRRDWLAGLAMQGMLANMPDKPMPEMVEHWDAIPSLAYKQADAIIEEGKK